jgi:hypothetical protein
VFVDLNEYLIVSVDDLLIVVRIYLSEDSDVVV